MNATISASDTPEATRDAGKALFEAERFAEAHAIFERGHGAWPNRLDFAIWVARCLEKLDRQDERRAMLDELVLTVEAESLPKWGARALHEQGYVIQRGVRLCLDHPAISPWMHQRMFRGDYEEIEADMLAASIQPGERILEVGGGLGFMAAFACLQAPDVRAVVYEANPGLVQVAEHTKRLNGADFDFRSAMLGASAGTTEFHVHAAFWASSASHESEDSTTIDVPVHDVNKVLAEQDFTMLVMDIEGGEIDLIPEMQLDTITRVVIETHPAVTGAKSVAKLLRHFKRSYGLRPIQERDDVFLLARER